MGWGDGDGDGGDGGRISRRVPAPDPIAPRDEISRSGSKLTPPHSDLTAYIVYLPKPWLGQRNHGHGFAGRAMDFDKVKFPPVTQQVPWGGTLLSHSLRGAGSG